MTKTEVVKLYSVDRVPNLYTNLCLNIICVQWVLINGF